MADAHTWLAKRMDALRLEYESEGDVQMEIDFYLMELARAVGAQLRGGRHAIFSNVLTLLVGEYALAPPDPAPVTAVNGIASALSPAQLEGAELRFARCAKGLKQSGLGELLGVSNYVISNWENAKYTPTEAERAKMRAVLGLDSQPMQLPLGA